MGFEIDLPTYSRRDLLKIFAATPVLTLAGCTKPTPVRPTPKIVKPKEKESAVVLAAIEQGLVKTPKSENQWATFVKTFTFNSPELEAAIKYVESLMTASPHLEGRLNGQPVEVIISPNSFIERVIVLAPAQYEDGTPGPITQPTLRKSSQDRWEYALPVYAKDNLIPKHPLFNSQSHYLNAALLEGICRTGLSIHGLYRQTPSNGFRPDELDKYAQNAFISSISITYLLRQTGLGYLDYVAKISRLQVNTPTLVNFMEFNPKDYESIPLAGLPIVQPPITQQK